MSPEWSRTNSTPSPTSSAPRRRRAEAPASVHPSLHPVQAEAPWASACCLSGGAPVKIRLHITPPAGAPFALDYSGPLLVVGRDPSCELPLQGGAAESVSWRHARIDLT